MDFFNYIKAVGTGPKGNRDLTAQEAQDMMHQILTQQPPREQISAFLLGWRLKPESIEELQGSLQACDELTQHSPIPNSLELGYPYDGKAKNPYLLPLIAQHLNKVDLPLVVTGDLQQPAKDGITLQTLKNHLEFPSNLHYFDRKTFLPQLHNLTALRNTLGLRTAFNTIEKLPNVAQSPYAITGVFHKPYVEKYLALFQKRYERFALIQGNEGTPELFSKGTLWVHHNDTITEIVIDPKHYGINYEKSKEKISMEISLQHIQEPSQELLTLAKLNASIYLFVAGETSTIDEGFEQLS